MFLKFTKKAGSENKIGSSRIENELCYCPECDTEYRSGVKECIHCKIALISGEERLRREQQVSAERQNRSMLIEPADPMMPLLAGTVRDMKAVRHKLKSAWIPSILTGDEGCVSGCSPQMTVMIKAADGEAARAVMERDFIESTGVSPDALAALAGAETVFDIQAKEVKCPACGCRFSPTVGACPDCGLNFI